jgi:hypothetical protein
MILKYFRRNIWRKKFDHNIDFEKNANFYAENWQKSPKIVIISLTPGFNESAVTKFRYVCYKILIYVHAYIRHKCTAAL